MICEPSPLLRLIDTPVIRCRDSAKFVSGNLPISSAVIASTTPVALRLRSIDLRRLARIPPSTITSSIAPSSAKAGTTEPIMATAILLERIFFLNDIISPLENLLIVFNYFELH